MHKVESCLLNTKPCAATTFFVWFNTGALLNCNKIMSVCSKNRSSQSCFSWQQKKKSWQCQEAQEYFNPHFLVHIPHLVEHYIVPNTCSSSLLQKNFPHVTLQWWVKFLVLCHLGRFSSLSPRMYLRNSRHQQYMQWKYCVSQQVWIFTSKSTKFHSLRVDFLTPKYTAIGWTF